jgi:hypothetical protein
MPELLTPIPQFAGTTNSPWCYFGTTGYQSTGVLEPTAAFGDMPEPLAHREMISTNGKIRFLTAAPSCLLSFLGLADTVSSLRWYSKTAGSLLREVSFQKGLHI